MSRKERKPLALTRQMHHHKRRRHVGIVTDEKKLELEAIMLHASLVKAWSQKPSTSYVQPGQNPAHQGPQIRGERVDASISLEVPRWIQIYVELFASHIMVSTACSLHL